MMFGSEFGSEYFNLLAEKEVAARWPGAQEKRVEELQQTGRSLPPAFAIALAALSIVTIAFAIWHH